MTPNENGIVEDVLQAYTEVIHLKMNLSSHFSLNYMRLFVLQVHKFVQGKI